MPLTYLTILNNVKSIHYIFQDYLISKHDFVKIIHLKKAYFPSLPTVTGLKIERNLHFLPQALIQMTKARFTKMEQKCHLTKYTLTSICSFVFFVILCVVSTHICKVISDSSIIKPYHGLFYHG